MAAKENIMDRIDTIKANSVKDEEFKATWGISLDEHLGRVMAHVRETDERVKKERGHV